MKRLIFLFLLASSLHAQTVVKLTTGTTTWSVPANWNSANNTVEVIGAGVAARLGIHARQMAAVAAARIPKL